MKIGINLLYIRPGKMGGAESFIRNVLDGFLKVNNSQFDFFLIVPIDYTKSWIKYKKSQKFHIISCLLNNNKAVNRIFYETFFFNKIIKLNKIDLIFNPVYPKSLFFKPPVSTITVIHDLQALHYPKYWSKIKLFWLKYIWKRSFKISSKIVTISNYVKKDIIKNFNISESKIKVIYIPVINSKKYCNFNLIRQKYSIEKQNYYYTVSSIAKHKNLITLLNVIKKINEANLKIPKRLIISGIGYKSKHGEKLLRKIEEMNISNNIILTGYISNIERDTLYKYAAVFLFPSIFEGFGMPPIEALIRGVPVVTTKRTSIPEVTKKQAIYVEDPFSVDEWINKIKLAINSNKKIIKFNEYSIGKIANEYLNLFSNIYNNKNRS